MSEFRKSVLLVSIDASFETLKWFINNFNFKTNCLVKEKHMDRKWRVPNRLLPSRNPFQFFCLIPHSDAYL